MTEKEKMQKGLLYNAADPELVRERQECKRLCREYNSLACLDDEAADEILKKMFGKIGERFRVEPDFWCDYGWGISAGGNFYMNHGCVILDGGGIRFGDNVQIGPQCGFYTAGHPLDIEQRNAGLEYARPIEIGNSVWIGGGVRVMPGVKIGDGAVIGAGSVVTRDIPPHVVAVGNPCRVIREL